MGFSFKKIGKNIKKSSQKTFSRDNLTDLGQDAGKGIKNIEIKPLPKDTGPKFLAGSNDLIKNIKEDSRKSIKSVSKGINRAADDIQSNMMTYLIIGGAGFLGVLMITANN